MKTIGILCAVDRELTPFLPIMQNQTTEVHAMLTFYRGTIGDKNVIAVCSGVCKVNAAITAQLLIDRYKVDAIINAGTCGGMDQKLEIFDTVITERSVYHDVDPEILTEAHPFMASEYFTADATLLTAAKKTAEKIDRIFFGTIVTGEQFITDATKPQIQKQFSPLSVDMETAAVAHVCYVNQIPFLAVRTLTDHADQSGETDFQNNCITSAARSKEVVCALIQNLKD